MDKDSDKGLKPSGFNSKFYGDNLPFDEYIDLMRNIITKGRIDLVDENASKIVLANSPFSWLPTSPQKPQNKYKHGVLLIHGLFDSPFYLRDLGEFFCDQNFLTRAILLPGHGTVPGDLLDIDSQEWVKAVEYGIHSLTQEVDAIYLAGYSLGALLALQYFLNTKNMRVKGLILFAPALEAKSKVKKFFAKYNYLFSWLSEKAKWYQIREPNNFAKYSSCALNGAAQASIIMEEVATSLKKEQVTIPLFMVLSGDDETVCNKAALSFFNVQPHPENKLLIYTNTPLKSDNKKIIIRPSHFPGLKIVNFSHTCITISPENSYLGNKSEFVDFLHYSNLRNIKKKDLHLGAASKENLKNYCISRLSYNPDFKNLLRYIDDFLKNTY